MSLDLLLLLSAHGSPVVFLGHLSGSWSPGLRTQTWAWAPFLPPTRLPFPPPVPHQ